MQRWVAYMSTVDRTSEDLGKGFAWAAAHRDFWVINMPHYGAFVFRGSRSEAEEMRAHKARWEGEVAHLSSASVSDVDIAPSTCWNHRGFTRVMTKTLRGKPRKRPLAYTMYCV